MFLGSSTREASITSLGMRREARVAKNAWVDSAKFRRAGRRFTPSSRSLHPHVFREIVIGGVVALINLHAPIFVVAAVENLGEKVALQPPGGFGRLGAVTARHGVVEPTVRRAGEHADRVGLVVALQAVAETTNIRERDQVIGLAENA